MNDLAHNPFSTSRIKPGAIGYRFAPGDSAAAVAARFAQHGWRGAIVGPHGTGKSTLLVALEPELKKLGCVIVKVRLSSGDRRLPKRLWTDCRRASLEAGQPGCRQQRLLVIDGFEQLSWLHRQWIRLRTKLCGYGLLVTTHGRSGLPTLLRTAGRLHALGQIVDELQRSSRPLVTQADVETAYNRCDGNIRESLFMLYDVYHQRNLDSRNSADRAAPGAVVNSVDGVGTSYKPGART